MIEIYYLTDEDRAKLIELNRKRESTPQQFRKEVQNEIKELLSRRKTLNQCSFSELVDLKRQYYDLFKKSIGITSSNTQYLKEVIISIEEMISFKKNDLVKEIQNSKIKKEQELKNRLRDKKNRMSKDNDLPIENQDISEWIVDFDKLG